MILDALAAVGFYVIPYLTGRLVVRRWLTAWAAGCLFWLAVFLVAGWAAGGLGRSGFRPVVAVTCIAVIVTSGIRLAGAARKSLASRPSSGFVPAAVLAVAACAVYFVIWSDKTPYPLQANWDAFEHIALANKIAAGHVSLRPSDISDAFTFNGYSTLFQVLLALIKVVFQRPLLGVYWWLNLGQYVLSVLATFALTRAVTDSRSAAFLAAMMTMLGFASFMVYQPLFFIPQNMAALTATAAACLAIWRRERVATLAPVLAVILLLHYIVGLVGAVVVAAVFIAPRSPLGRALIHRRVVFAGPVLLALSIGLHFVGGWQLTDREEASHFLLPLGTEFQLFGDWYGLGGIVFFALGCWNACRSDKAWERLGVTTALSLLALSTAPFSYVLKVFAVGYYFANLTIGRGIAGLMDRLSTPGRILAASWLTLAFVAVFYRNATYFKEPLYFKGYESNVSQAELQAADWLSASGLSQDALVISDPASQHIFEALADVNTQGGAYMSLETRRLLAETATTGPNAAADTFAIVHDELPFERAADRRTLVVLSARYFAWLDMPSERRESFYYNVWQPLRLSSADKSRIAEYAASPRFRLLYDNDELAILELQPATERNSRSSLSVASSHEVS